MDRNMGIGMAIEYANLQGELQRKTPANGDWDYTAFAHAVAAPEPDATIHLTFEKIPGSRGGYNRWTINGKSRPQTNPVHRAQGKRYRVVMHNNSGDRHPLHFHRQTFELAKKSPTDHYPGS